MAAKCTICGMSLIGHPDDDVACAACEQANLAGDLLRYPPQGARFWWLAARRELEPRQDQPEVAAYITYNPREWNPSQGGMPPRPRPVPNGLRPLTRAAGWRWRPELGSEEGPHGD